MAATGQQPGDGEIVAFGAAAGEDDLGSAATKQFCHRLACVLDRRPRLLSVVVDGGGVAKVLRKIRAHGLKHVGQNRSSGIIVEVNAAHTEPESILREARVCRS